MTVIGSLAFLFFFYTFQFKFYFISPPQLFLLPKRLLINVLPALVWLVSIRYLLTQLYLFSMVHFPTLFNYFSSTSLLEKIFSNYSLMNIGQLIFIILFLDHATYWWHRLMHQFHWTRKLHRHHHSDLFVDTTTAYRFHLLELTLQFLFKFLFSFIIGIGFADLITFEYILFFCGLFHHSRFNVPDLKIIVTPKFHFNHHLVDLKYANSNFGSIFTFWDQLYQTKTSSLNQFENQKFGSR